MYADSFGKERKIVVGSDALASLDAVLSGSTASAGLRAYAEAIADTYYSRVAARDAEYPDEKDIPMTIGIRIFTPFFLEEEIRSCKELGVIAEQLG